jgi:hypothetical protein
VCKWRSSGDEELAKLIVSPARAEWILKRYPPSDQGRPGILHSDPRGSKRVRETDEIEPEDSAEEMEAVGVAAN